MVLVVDGGGWEVGVGVTARDNRTGEVLPELSLSVLAVPRRDNCQMGCLLRCGVEIGLVSTLLLLIFSSFI